MSPAIYTGPGAFLQVVDFHERCTIHGHRTGTIRSGVLVERHSGTVRLMRVNKAGDDFSGIVSSIPADDVLPYTVGAMIRNDHRLYVSNVFCSHNGAIPKGCADRHEGK